jgi:hypothetical protein
MSGKKSVLGRGLAELSPFMAQHARAPAPAGDGTTPAAR